MAKKGKKAKAATAAVAAAAPSQAASTTASDLDLQLSHSRVLPENATVKLDHILEEKSTSFSLPSSPVIKVTPSIQPSPALSASVAQTADEDFKPVSLPPLNISEVLEPGVFPDIDWSLFNTQPSRGKKRVKPKRHDEARPQSPEPEEEEKSEPTDTISQVGGQVQVHEEPSKERPKETHAEPEPNPVTSTSPQQHSEYPYFPPFPYHPGYYQRGRMSHHMPYGYGPGDGSPYQAPYGMYAPYPYPHPRKLERHDSMASRGSGSGDTATLTPPQMIADNSSAIEDDPSDLLGRLHLAIPDLELLLRRYKETHGELGLREALVRKKEAESAEVAKRKEEHINRLMNQFHDAETKHAREYNKLRLHIGNLEENMKDLEERLHMSETQRKHEAANNRELSEQKTALVRERMMIAKAASDERDRLIAEFESSKTNAQRQVDAERVRVAELITQKDELESSSEKARAEYESSSERARAEYESSSEKARAEHESAMNSIKSELEGAANSAKVELEGKANAAQEVADKALKEIEELKTELKSEKEANANGWEEKRNQLVAELEEQKQALFKSRDEEIESLKKAHKDDLNEQTRAFVGLQESLNLKMTTENHNLLEEIVNLKKAWDEDKAKFEKMIEDLKGVAQGMEEEKGRLQKIVQQFAEETDVKSKGDMHYVEAFKQLSDLIFELSSTYFKVLPANTPPDIIAGIPKSLASIFEESAGSAESRIAYVAHMISTILNDRIFTPFLFGLGRRSEGTEALLESVSDQLRTKSSRKEATWRQHTLLAAYTTTDAKLRMNKEAGRVMDDIVTAILPFAAEAETKVDEIRIAVRKVVKLAVETWRYARLEREKIETVMPAQIDMEGTSEEEAGFWLPYSLGGSGCINSDADSLNKADKKMILRLFPFIRREPVDEGFVVGKTNHTDNGCVYSKGWALYAV